jgi:hypothetical protein
VGSREIKGVIQCDTSNPKGHILRVLKALQEVKHLLSPETHYKLKGE